MAKIDEMTIRMPAVERIRQAEARAEEMEARYDRLTLEVKRLTEERDAARAISQDAVRDFGAPGTFTAADMDAAIAKERTYMRALIAGATGPTGGWLRSPKELAALIGVRDDP